MKRLVVGLSLVLLLAIGAIAYAHGPGWWGGGSMTSPGYGSGYMMGNGMMGNGMMGNGMMGMMGSGMMGSPAVGAPDQKFLDETAALRKELYNKKFEYFEAFRNPKTPPETIAKLEKEIRELQEKIYKKAPRTASGMYGSSGCK